MVKNCLPVELDIVRRFAVWFVTPCILSVVEPTELPWKKTRLVEVVLGATAKDDKLLTVTFPPKVELPFGKLIPPLGSKSKSVLELVPWVNPFKVLALMANPAETMDCRGESVSNWAVEVLNTSTCRK